jgi:hypothetical protein
MLWNDIPLFHFLWLYHFSLRHRSILQQIWLNFMTLSLVFIRRLFQFSSIFRISNFFDQSITEETWVVEMRIWCIKIGNVLVLHLYVSICMNKYFVIAFFLVDLSYLQKLNNRRKYPDILRGIYLLPKRRVIVRIKMKHLVTVIIQQFFWPPFQLSYMLLERLFILLRPAQEFFNYTETSPLPVKGWKI